MSLTNQILKSSESYLSNREWIVKIKNKKSKSFDVTSGMGQGYPIGATLFILFVIDLPFVISDDIV